MELQSGYDFQEKRRNGESRALNIYHSGLAWVMGFGIPQECDSVSANGSIFAPMKSGQPRWIYVHEAMISALPVSLC